jgi:hypothetical protein
MTISIKKGRKILSKVTYSISAQWYTQPRRATYSLESQPLCFGLALQHPLLGWHYSIFCLFDITASSVGLALQHPLLVWHYSILCWFGTTASFVGLALQHPLLVWHYSILCWFGTAASFVGLGSNLFTGASPYLSTNESLCSLIL